MLQDGEYLQLHTLTDLQPLMCIKDQLEYEQRKLEKPSTSAQSTKTPSAKPSAANASVAQPQVQSPKIEERLAASYLVKIKFLSFFLFFFLLIISFTIYHVAQTYMQTILLVNLKFFWDLIISTILMSMGIIVVLKIFLKVKNFAFSFRRRLKVIASI